ncbi:hypothetical protein AVEN_70814-1 [Araneus ventricosus]|uniref:Uncharacterized protein n=1 Tax=Araneus ventricosus TaxID=182803 RepID=A0A4Y2VQP4_ARAVE|nr:hypothetical protein AVEN_70814-1 [Araneus ventricosus]
MSSQIGKSEHLLPKKEVLTKFGPHLRQISNGIGFLTLDSSTPKPQLAPPLQVSVPHHQWEVLWRPGYDLEHRRPTYMADLQRNRVSNLKPKSRTRPPQPERNRG